MRPFSVGSVSRPEQRSQRSCFTTFSYWRRIRKFRGLYSVTAGYPEIGNPVTLHSDRDGTMEVVEQDLDIHYSLGKYYRVMVSQMNQS